MKLEQQDLQRLYGDRFFLMKDGQEMQQQESSQTKTEEAAQTPDKPADAVADASGKPTLVPITWKLKAESKVLFILSAEEMGNRTLTDLLKKIVDSLEISRDFAGFGILPAAPALPDFTGLPAAFGVVFNADLNPGTANPGDFEGNSVYFSHTLTELSDNRDHKMALWKFLQTVKAQLQS